MAREMKQYEDDDGRVICNMDVDGMPPRSTPWFAKHNRREENPALTVAQGEPMTKSEALRYTWNAVLAGLLIVGVFSATWVLFILFCIHVWFR